MKKPYSLLQFAGFSFLLLAGTAISSPSSATIITRNQAVEYVACHNAVTSPNIGTETPGEFSKEVSVSGRERKRFARAGIKKRFGVIGRSSRFERKPLGCPSS